MGFDRLYSKMSLLLRITIHGGYFSLELMQRLLKDEWVSVSSIGNVPC